MEILPNKLTSLDVGTSYETRSVKIDSNEFALMKENNQFISTFISSTSANLSENSFLDNKKYLRISNCFRENLEEKKDD